jgi:cytochrome c1
MRFAFAAAALFAAFAAPAFAQEEDALATEAMAPEHHHFHHEGVFGTFDRAALQRGYQVYRQVCAACHSMEYLTFRTLGQEGGPFYDEDYPNPIENPVIKALAAEFQITDGPNEFGDMFQRAGQAADVFPAPFANPQAAAAVNGGAVPPDLSVITKARHHGEHYVASLMLGYEVAPEGFPIQPGQYYNRYFEGRLIAMPPQLLDGIVTYADGTEATAEQMAEDVATFLAWAAEPKQEARKRMGLAVIAFLIILAGLVFGSYRAIWRNVEH